MIGRLILFIAALVAVSLGHVTPTAVADPSPTVMVDSYEAPICGQQNSYTTPEHEPPIARVSESVSSGDRAASQGSDGTSVCPRDAVAMADTAHNHDRVLANLDTDGPTAGRRSWGIRGDAPRTKPSGVAANTGSRIAEASSSAFKAADNVGDWTVSAKHLPGAGGRWNKWAEGVDINGTVASALRSDGASFLPNAGTATDRFIVRTNMGTAVGTRGQTFVKAVVSNDGRIITAYPVK